MKWIFTKDALPKKPGKRNYEHVECLLRMKNVETLIRPWNCEHLCWDDRHGDDFEFHPTEPMAWMLVSQLPSLPNEPEGGAA